MKSEHYKLIHSEVKDLRMRKKHILLFEAAKRLDAENNQELCVSCRRFAPGSMTIDHIIPDSLLVMFGIDTDLEWDEENIQIMCRPCNSFKANRLDFKNPKTKPLLLKYIERI